MYRKPPPPGRPPPGHPDYVPPPPRRPPPGHPDYVPPTGFSSNVEREPLVQLSEFQERVSRGEQIEPHYSHRTGLRQEPQEYEYSHRTGLRQEPQEYEYSHRKSLRHSPRDSPPYSHRNSLKKHPSRSDSEEKKGKQKTDNEKLDENIRELKRTVSTRLSEAILQKENELNQPEIQMDAINGREIAVSPNVFQRGFNYMLYAITRLPIASTVKLGGLYLYKLFYIGCQGLTMIYSIPVVGPPLSILLIIYLFVCKFTRPFMLFFLEIIKFLYRISPDIGFDAAMRKLADFAFSIGTMYLIDFFNTVYGFADTVIEKILTVTLFPITTGLHKMFGMLSKMTFLQKHTLDLVEHTKDVVMATNANTQELLLQNREIIENMNDKLVKQLLNSLLSTEILAVMGVPIAAGITDNIQELLENKGRVFEDLIRSQTEKLARDIAIREKAQTYKLDLISDELREFFLENLETQRVATNTYQLLIENNDRREAQEIEVARLIRNHEQTMGALDYIASTTERNLYHSRLYHQRFDILKDIVYRIETEQRLTDGQLHHMLEMLNTIKGELMHIGIDNKHKNLQKTLLETVHLITRMVTNPAQIMRYAHPQLMDRGGRRTRRRKHRKHKTRRY
jgi:hypothetical protein